MSCFVLSFEGLVVKHWGGICVYIIFIKSDAFFVFRFGMQNGWEWND